MPAPLVLWDQDAAYASIQAFLILACPSVSPSNIYRARPGAVPANAAGPSIVIEALSPAPAYLSPFGAEQDTAQVQRWRVTISTAAPGAWTATLLGQTSAPFVAGPLDTATDIAAGIAAAIDALGLDVTTTPTAPPSASFEVASVPAGVSLGLSITAPVGGAASLAILDDSIRRAVWNWGVWRVRLLFRDVPSSQAQVSRSPRSLSATLAESVRLMLQASSLPTVQGLAYPYARDNLQAAPARLSWRSSAEPLAVDIVENGLWVRTVALDVDFDTPVALTHDVPSLDAIGLASLVILDE